MCNRITYFINKNLFTLWLSDVKLDNACGRATLKKHWDE